MKILLSMSLMVLPMLVLAWDGDGYDYKLGRADNPKKEEVYRVNDDAELDNSDRNGYGDLNAEYFQRLNDPINWEIRDPREFLDIEAIPNYLWKD